MENKPTNEQIGDLLNEIADLLDLQDANPFRVRAYRDGAQSVRAADESLTKVVETLGPDALQTLPDIGEGLAGVIADYVRSGRSTLLDDLRGESTPEQAITKVSGIGPKLAERIVEQLDVQTLLELERAAHDGRLAEVDGFGTKRLQAVCNSLAGMLSESAQRRSRQRVAAGDASSAQSAGAEHPSVAVLLDVDEEYRQRAKKDDLQKIAPRRFNRKNEAWLPLLHIKCDGWQFTALFSNTARAHELERTDDWVVIYYRQEGESEDAERQNTVVTETRGTLEGKRVVRGRERECRSYYESQSE